MTKHPKGGVPGGGLCLRQPDASQELWSDGEGARVRTSVHTGPPALPSELLPSGPQGASTEQTWPDQEWPLLAHLLPASATSLHQSDVLIFNGGGVACCHITGKIQSVEVKAGPEASLRRQNSLRFWVATELGASIKPFPGSVSPFAFGGLSDPCLQCPGDRPGLRPQPPSLWEAGGGNWCWDPGVTAAVTQRRSAPACACRSPSCWLVPVALSRLSPGGCRRCWQSHVHLRSDRPWTSTPTGAPPSAGLPGPLHVHVPPVLSSQPLSHDLWSPRSAPGPRSLPVQVGAWALGCVRPGTRCRPALLLRAPLVLPVTCSHRNQIPSEGNTPAPHTFSLFFWGFLIVAQRY